MAIPTPTTEITNPRLLLQAELTRRIQHNPRYSLRRFAQALGMSHTVLSLVLSGKRPLSKKAAGKVSDFFGLNPTQRERLVSHRKSPPLEPASVLSLDTFAVVSDWYHFAILSLLEIPKSRFTPRWIASRLGISEIEAKGAVERLLRLGLVEKNPEGEWRQAGKPIRFDNRQSTAATRKFHSQILARAQDSLEHDPFEAREFSSVTFALDSAQLSHARDRIKAFSRELMRELESRGNPKQVYNLSIQIFPLSKPSEET